MPRMAPKRKLSTRQQTASYAGWLGLALLMATLLYWLYLSGIDQSKNWIVTAGLWAGAAMLLYFVWGMGSVIITNLRSPEGKRSIRSAVLIVAILAILSVSNVLAYRRHYQWDLTGNRRLTLAPMTKRILEHLGTKIHVTAFYSQSPQRRFEAQESRQTRDLLDQYADRSQNFTFQFVDYLKEPDKFVSAKMSSLPPVVLFTNDSGGREEVKGTTEKDFTAAILKLSRKQKHKIYFTAGHGELNPDGGNPQQSASVVKQVLQDEQHEIAAVDLMGKDRKVPDDCSVLVVAGPQVEFKPEEAKAVTDYLGRGGHALFLVLAGGPNLSGLVKDWGVKIGDNLVGQLVNLGGGLAAISKNVRIAQFESHDIDRGLSSITFPLVRTIDPATPAPTGVTVTTVLRTNADTYSKPLLFGQRRVDLRPQKQDPKGPFSVAVAAEKTSADPKKKGRIVVIGGGEWAMDLLAEDPTTSNRYLFTNAVNWLANEDELVDIPPKEDRPEQVFLTPEQRIRTLFVNLLLVPVVCLFMSVFVWWKRR